MSDNCKSTRQLLAKIPNVPCLYRHTVNGIYYGEKKIGRKRKEHSLGTTDRKLAERRLKLRIDELDRIDAKAAKITLAALLDKFLAANQGKAAKTRATDQSAWKSAESSVAPLDARSRLHLRTQLVRCGITRPHRGFVRLPDRAIGTQKDPFGPQPFRWNSALSPAFTCWANPVMAWARPSHASPSVGTSADFVSPRPSSCSAIPTAKARAPSQIASRKTGRLSTTPGGIYTSTDSGVTWTQSDASPNINWRAVASSADGTLLAAASYDQGIWTSAGALNPVQPALTFHYRLVAMNREGTSYGSDQTFTTPATPPAVTTLAASDVTATSATLNGTVNPNGGATTAYFRYGLTTSYGSFTASNSLPAPNAMFALSNLVGNLAPATTYHYQMVGSNSLGRILGADLTFTTSPDAPSPTTLAASSSSTSATLNGTVNPNDAATKAYFRYGLTPSYGSFSATNSLAAGNAPLSVANLIGSLTPGTLYHYQLVSSSALGTTVGINLTFTTSAGTPAATTLAASAVTAAGATLNGSVNPQGGVTTAYFQYGLTTNYGSFSATNSLATTNVALSVSNLIGSLASGTTYHYRLVGVNNRGSANGADLTFTSTPTSGGSGLAGDLNGDGVVSQAELDAIYGNYVTNSPWLRMTNVAGLGGTNVSFSLSNSVLGAYSVLYSTNLATWQYLGPATPRYLFTDTNAPALPQRSYRLRYP